MAAGLGFKNFASGEVLTAADVNAYLNSQTVMVFADATARTAAIASPQEGMFSYLKDTNATQYYTGSAWTNLDTTGMVNPMTTTGDTIYSSSGTTPARLGIGTTGQVLTVAGGVPTWATPAGGGGKVLQVVYNSYNLGVTTTSTSLVDTNLSATITPTSATSKILVIVSQNGCGKNATSTGRLTLAILRSSTVLQYLADVAGYTNDAAINYFNNVSGTYLDTPNTTSATTYKTQFLSEGGSAVFVNDTYANTYKSASTITLMEIGA
jgi:hypothetical protein